MTRTQLEEIIEETVHRTLEQKEASKGEKVLIGVKEISDHLGISTATCQRFITSGAFGDAIFYVGRQVRGYSDRLLDSVKSIRR